MPCRGQCGRSMAEQERQRLFFALWPDESVRQRLADYRPLLNGCGGRPVVLENLHITLAFLGSVDVSTRACLEKAADAINAPAFTLRMDQLGFWRRPHVVWLGAHDIPQPLLVLVAALKQAMIGCGLEPESRHFQAHLTLMRKAWRAPLELNPPVMTWPVTDFALVASDTRSEGVRYEVLRRWSLI